MKKSIILLMLLCLSMITYAVNPIKEGNMISGHVIVKGTEENIPYATVLIIGSGQGTVSNEEGQFEFRKLPAGKYKLRVSAVGYKTQEKEVTVSKDFTAVIHFPMEEESFMTDEVVVSANRNEVSRKSIYQFLDHTPEDCLKVFDINLRQNFYTKEVICESLKRCNVLKINDEELITIGRLFGYPGLDIENKCWLILGKYNLDMLVLTCGVNGSYVFAPGFNSFQETPKVEVADTVGAGDSFTGTFCASILKGKSIAEAHKLAVEVSAYVCTQHGAMPVLPEKYTK